VAVALSAGVAVTFGAEGLVEVNAVSSNPSAFVAITPTRILETRTDVGLAGPFVSGASQTLQVTGTVPTQPPANVAPVKTEEVPAAASSVVVVVVVFNVSVVSPATKGFLSTHPGDASGTPATSNINWAAGGANIANAVTTQLPASHTINIFVNGTVGRVLIDVAGYYIAGEIGDPGADRVQGIPGNNGTNDADGVPVRRDGPTITSLSATADNVGRYTSIAVGADANPIISYYDNNTTDDLKVPSSRVRHEHRTLGKAEPTEPDCWGNGQASLFVAPPCATSPRCQQRAC
jgi:hypothetical protein